MRLFLPGSVSSPKGENSSRFGTRTRKKHKRLDAICENLFNRNRGVRIGLNEGSGGRESVGDESELRRSSRVRRAPVVLDASPPPPRKRRKIDQNGKGISRGFGERVKGEPVSSLRSRLRSRVKNADSGMEKRKVDSPRAKRSLFEDLYEVKDEVQSVGGRLRDRSKEQGGEKLRAVKSARSPRIRASCDLGAEVHENSVNTVAVFASQSDDEVSLSLSETVGEDDEEISYGTSDQEDEKGSKVSDHSVSEMQIVNDADKTVGQNKPLQLPENAEEEAKLEDTVEVAARHQNFVEDGLGNGDSCAITKHEEKNLEGENAKKLDNSVPSSAGGRGKGHIKEGRRCGLCGTSGDGKPPKKLVLDGAGSDNEAYSGSSASEEPNYDQWDGFGDESSWLGRLLGPVNDRYGIAGIWVHQQCAVWSPEVYFAGLGCLKNIRAALCRGRALKCTRCGRRGATIGCRVDRCPRTYHLPCARASGCIFYHREFLIACTDHRYLFQPHGPHYAQHIKKLKAKKMKLEMKKLSNDALRKDVEAEEKWFEKCGEDEEFLKRETKRLQRDMLRIAPIYIGGSHSEGEKLFEGWESVGGLQDVIRCMKEVVILPLLYPEFFENLGLTPPRGVLLHGYPGTGKTLIVRALIGSCARGDRRIAYFARKGADCLGKYVGDAERQLRLLFQVAERSQPSIIFFDEIDGLAPVRTRNQDQTHSSVVSTLLALMDGLKSRGSVIVIGATNRPDAVDPALRRPGRFDREIYFPLPSIKDRAAILTLHTRMWPRPVTGSVLQWIATRTVGFAGADLQALCSQAALTALKRHCPLQEILSTAAERPFKGKHPELPGFVVEERDWIEALLRCPPPCSRREAGMAANEIVGSPLRRHLVPSLLQPLCNLLISLYIDDRIWLPPPLVKAVSTIKDVIISAAEQEKLPTDEWWCNAGDLIQESDIANDIARRLSETGILVSDATACCSDLSDIGDDFARSESYTNENTYSVMPGNLSYAPRKKGGYRILIAGNARSGQKQLASCILQGFVGNVEIQKIDFATISQEGHGDLLQGVMRVLSMYLKYSSLKMCALFLPRIDLWATVTHHEVPQKDSDCELISSLDSCDSDEVSDTQNEGKNSSQIWNFFVEMVESICLSASLIILATSEVPCAQLPERIRQFFGSDSLPLEVSMSSEYTVPRITLQVDGRLNCDVVMQSAAAELSAALLFQFVQFVHQRSHPHSNSNVVPRDHNKGGQDCQYQKTSCGPAEGPEAQTEVPKVTVVKVPVPPNTRSIRTKSNLSLAITTFGYQILRYPHFAELCWVTSKLKEGPCADIRGPWKGWPFNSCIIRPDNSLDKNAIARSSGNIKGKDKCYLVRGLNAVCLSAYRGAYTSLAEVSFEVRKVLELLVKQINTKIQAGKDRYQFIGLLSQVAYLEDVVNSWTYSMRSLEMDAQTTAVVKPIGGGSLDGHLTCENATAQLNGESTCLCEGLHQSEPLESGLQGFMVETTELPDLNKVYTDVCGDNSGDLINIEEASEVKVVSPVINPKREHGSPQKEPLSMEAETVLADHHPDYMSRADVPGSTTFNESGTVTSNENGGTRSEPFESEQLNDLTAGGGTELLKQTNGFTDRVSPVNLNNDARRSGELNCGKLCGSCKVCNQSTSSTMEIDDFEVCKNSSDMGLNSSSEKSAALTVESGVFCSYYCCNGCVHSLHQLVHKMVIEEWELAGGCLNVGDAHDLVGTLSMRLSSALVKLFNAEGFCRKLFESREMDKCQCRNPEGNLITPMECTCHLGKCVTSVVSSSPCYRLGFNSEFVYRDGVLVPADAGKDANFHCKYETLCLCSLIELIVITTKQSSR
ncbi:hypothetical protein Dimus_018925 [Dionaea muscipula]